MSFVSRVYLHAYASTCVLPRDVYFHAFTPTRCVFPHVYFHETCTLHYTSKRGPCKHVTGMHCGIAIVPRKITLGKMKLQLGGTVHNYTVQNTHLHYYHLMECRLPVINHKLRNGVHNHENTLSSSLHSPI